MQTRKNIVRAAVLGVTSVIASAQFAQAQSALNPGYVIGNGALTPNGETLFIDNARAGGGDANSDAFGFFSWAAVLPNRWIAGEQISLTGLAIPLVVTAANPEATTNNTRDGTFTFQFYDLGADNTFTGTASETLVGSAQLTFDNIGGTSTYSGIFDAPVNFTATGNGLAMRIQHSTNARTKIEPVANSQGVTRNSVTTGDLVSGTNAGYRMSLAGFNFGDPLIPRWKGTGTDDWGTASNWSNNTVPNAAGVKTILGNVLAAPSTINLNGSRTIGKLEFTSTQGYTIAAGSGGTLILNNNADPAELTVFTGNHAINAPVQLDSSTNVTTPDGTQLTLAAVSGAQGLNKLGAGTLVLSESVSYAGPTIVSAGSVVLGGGASTVTLANVGLASEGTLDYRNPVNSYATADYTSGNLGTVRVGAGTLNVTPAGGAIAQSNVVVASGTTLNTSAFASGYDMGVGQSMRIAGTVISPVLKAYSDNSIGVGDDAVRAVGVATVNGSLALNGSNPASADGLVVQLIGTGTVTGPSDQLQVTGQLLKTGANPYRITIIPDIGARLAPSYDIITHNGGSVSASDFELVGAQAFPDSRISYAVDTSTPNVVKVVEVGSELDLTWTGANGNFWDVASTTNFVDSAANPEQFRTLDNVIFDDTSTVKGVVTVGDIYASEVVFDTDTQYSLRHSGNGQGMTGHMTLIKRGTGKLVLESSFDFTGGGTSTFTGPVFVEEGTLSFGGGIVNSGGPANTVGVDIAAGATLELWRVNTGGNVPNFYFPFSGAGEIVKRGDTVALTGNSPTYTGLIRIEEGTLQINNPAAFGAADQGVVANGNGALRMNIAGAYTVADAITINSTGTSTLPQLAIGGQGTGTLTAPVTFNTTDGFIQVDGGSTLSLAGGLTASGDITANGAGNLRLGPSTINGSVSRTNTTGTLFIDDDVTVGGTLSLTAANGAAVITAVADPVAPSVLAVGGVSLTAGTTSATRIDITNNILQVNYTGSSPLPQLLGLIIDGRDDDDSNGNVLDAGESVIYSSLLPIAGQDIGYLDNGSAVRIRKTILGDADVDGTVGFSDLLALAQNYNLPSGAFWFQGDFDYSGDVGFSDLLVLAQNYNGSLALAHSDLLTGGSDARFAADFALAMSVVPEPSSLLLVALTGLALVRRRR